MKAALLVVLLIAILAVGGFAYFRGSQPVSSPQPSASPAVTVTPSSQPAQNELLILESPLEGAVITSPLVITGRARGPWYFEATFPVVLTDWDGKIIAEGYATAQGDWMTEEFVPFTAELSFTKPEYGERGSLILQKANPSGLPENDDALEITVFFE